MMTTEATREQSLNFGCVVADKDTGSVRHFVEKPQSYVSTLINCGIYVFSVDIFPEIAKVFYSRQEGEMMYNNNNGGNKDRGYIRLEQDLLAPLAGTGRLYSFVSSNWWSQVKTAGKILIETHLNWRGISQQIFVGSAIYANRHYLELSKRNHPERFQNNFGCTIIPNVYIHPSASVHPTAVLGPNVSISRGNFEFS